MIYDKLSEIARYRGLSENLDMGIRFLQSTDLFSLPMGRTEILGSDVYCNRFNYTTVPISQSSLMEAHERYLDIHIVLSGLEQVMVAPIETRRRWRSVLMRIPLCTVERQSTRSPWSRDGSFLSTPVKVTCRSLRPRPRRTLTSWS